MLTDLTEETTMPQNICCGVTSKQNYAGLAAKTAWLKERMKEGLVFRKAEEAGNSGKVFIEYIPSEYAWVPLVSKNNIHINCFWVSGRFAGHGFGKALYQSCEANAIQRNNDAITVICQKKKAPYFAEPKFFIKQGFEITDEYNGYIVLVKLLTDIAKNNKPVFNTSIKEQAGVVTTGLHVFYSVQCPFTNHYMKEVQNKAQEENIPFVATLLDTREKAQNAPVPWTTYGAFYNGVYLGHEILTAKTLMQKLEKYSNMLDNKTIVLPLALRPPP